MNSLIITVAGLSSRFNRDIKEPVLKCLYFEGESKYSLLSQQIDKFFHLVDEIIVVGGYKYDELVSYVRTDLNNVNSKIKCVYNEHYRDLGSAYSLLKGIEGVDGRSDSIIFIEGDLFFDSESAERIVSSSKDVVSVCSDPILSDKAVALYIDVDGYPHYVYDTCHSFLEIPEPFKAIYNSGQMWKFRNSEKLLEICRHLTPDQKKGTNLEIIQRYFGNIHASELDIVCVKDWFNCNTIADYRQVYQILTK
jgi:CTP:molybdopterin cytidylyltransferase MocA